MTSARTEIETLPRAAVLSSALAAEEITPTEYNGEIQRIKTPICETTWAEVKPGDLALVARYGQVVKVKVRAVEKGAHSVLIDYIVEGRSYHGVFYPPNETAFIQQRG